MDSWAVDLKDIGAIYPWQGAEVLMVIVAVVLWLVWHVWQMRHETATYEEEIRKYASDSDKIKKALDTHP